MIRRPVEREGSQPLAGRVRVARDAIPDELDVVGLRHRGHGRGVGVHHQHVGTRVDQRLGGLAFLGRVVERVDPKDLDLDVLVDALCAQCQGVQGANLDRYRVSPDLADDVGLGGHRGQHPVQIPAVLEPDVKPREVGADVGAEQVHKLRVGVSRGCLLEVGGGVPTGHDHQAVALLTESAQRLLGLRARVDVGNHRHLGSRNGGLELVHSRCPGGVPAPIIGRAVEHDRDLGGLVRRCARGGGIGTTARPARPARARRECDDDQRDRDPLTSSQHVHVPPFGSKCRPTDHGPFKHLPGHLSRSGQVTRQVVLLLN